MRSKWLNKRRCSDKYRRQPGLTVADSIAEESGTYRPIGL